MPVIRVVSSSLHAAHVIGFKELAATLFPTLDEID